jgi:hypothetical protein
MIHERRTVDTLASLASARRELPEWHKDELRQREQEIASGEATFISWEEAKADILRRTS